MRLFTLYELLRMSNLELVALRTDVERRLLDGACDRQIALANLGLISRVLSRNECVNER